MKRIILASVSLAAMTFSATTAMAAGSTANVVQSGTRQGAVIRQETATGATANVNQSGADNAFNILQEGSSNTSNSTQVGFARAGNTQDTSGNYIAEGPSKSNFGNVIQRGTNGSSTLNQTNNNRALIEQTATSVGSTSNVSQNQPDITNALVSGGVPNGTDRQNSAVVTQAGNGSVTIAQVGFISQSAAGNAAIALQTSTANGAESVISQNGSGNLASTVQSGSGGYSYIQQGQPLSQGQNSGNSAIVTQDGNSDSFVVQAGGDISEAIVDQRGGDFNLSSINQSKGTGSALSKADVGQVGFDNRSFVTQTGEGGSATVRQTQTIGASNGDRSNLSSIQQVAFSTANVTQTGDENDSYITQAGVNAAPGSFVTVTQNGVRAFSSVNQTASSARNTATVNQSGTDLTSGIIQSGIGGSATVTQTASLNQSFATQGGTNGVLFVNQSGTGNLSGIEQGGGDQNYASVTQQTSNNVSSVSQSGSFNSAFVTQ